MIPPKIPTGLLACAGIGRAAQLLPPHRHLTKMSSFRLLSAAARTAPRVLGRRGYAEAASDKLKLSLVLPHKVCTEPALETRVVLTLFVVDLLLPGCCAGEHPRRVG